MAISLNQIVGILSDRVGKPFSIPLQQQLKVIIKYKRANYMQQFIEKHPEQRQFFSQDFVVKLEKVNTINDPCGLETSKDCPILRTACEIPQPLRNSYMLFDYVGEPSLAKGFSMIKPEFLDITASNKYTAKVPKWWYTNNRIYIYNNLTQKVLGVRGIFEDPESVNNCCDGDNCFDDDSRFPIPQDLLNAIMRDVLQVELRSQFPDFGEVEIDTDNVQTKGR